MCGNAVSEALVCLNLGLEDSDLEGDALWHSGVIFPVPDGLAEIAQGALLDPNIHGL